MLVESSDIQDIIDSARSLKIEEDECLLIMAGEKNEIDYSILIQKLDAEGINFFGGIFPGVIYKNKRSESGVVLSKIKSSPKPIVVNNLSAKEYKIPEIDFSEVHKKETEITALVLVDGLTPNIAAFLSELFSVYGSSIHYFGGGAGSLSLKQKPCLFTNEGIFQDGAIISFIPTKSKLGVKHGWERKRTGPPAKIMY